MCHYNKSQLKSSAILTNAVFLVKKEAFFYCFFTLFESVALETRELGYISIQRENREVVYRRYTAYC